MAEVDDLQKQELELNKKFDEFKKTVPEFNATFPNIKDFEKKMLAKGYILMSSSDYLSAIIYFSLALWSYAISGNQDKDSISALQNLVIQTRQKFKQSMASKSQDEDIIIYKPVEESKMINKETGEILSFDTMAGALAEKKMMMDKFIYPLTYSFLYLKEENNVLLYGPPGTGKTLLAKASVGQLNKDPKLKFIFYSLSADSVKSKWEGGTEKNIAELFDNASKEAAKYQEESRRKGKDITVKSILFLDEVESIAQSRDSGGDPRSVTTLLQQMDGFKSNANVLVMAATNYPWQLDTAFLRRFTARVFVDLPDFIARAEIVADYIIAKYGKSKELDLDRLLTLNIFIPKTRSGFSETFNIYKDTIELEPSIDNYITQIYNKKNILKFTGYLSSQKKYACIIASKIIKIFQKNKMELNHQQKWIERQKNNLVVLAEFLFFISDITGPSPTSLIDGQLISGRRTSELAMSKYGYSPSDLEKVVSEFFSITARKIIQSCYIESGNCNNDAVIDKHNCYKQLISCNLIKPSKIPGHFNVLIDKDKSKPLSKRFVNEQGDDIYTVIIPDYFLQALTTYKTTVGNSDMYCNFIEYYHGAETPNLSKRCKDIKIPYPDFLKDSYTSSDFPEDQEEESEDGDLFYNDESLPQLEDRTGEIQQLGEPKDRLHKITDPTNNIQLLAKR